MILRITRYCNLERYGCIGEFVLEKDNGSALVKGYTAENPWRGNANEVSCIPEGVYKAGLHNSPQFGRTLWLKDVPERTEILVHVANSQTDVLGCIGPGDDYGWWADRGELAVWNSQETLDRIIQAIQDRGQANINVDIRWHHPAYP